MKIIAFSEKDTAGSNIGRILTESNIEKNDVLNDLMNDVRILKTKESITMLQEEEFKNLNLNPEVIIVASRHRSKSETPTLTLHSPGNFGSADFGGEERRLSICPARYIRKALIEFSKEKEKRNLSYEVSLEVTHHGPTLDVPIIFVEVGSAEKQWNDLNACSAAAEVIKKLASENLDDREAERNDTDVAVGFGGTHYAPNFTRLILEKQISFGHIMPKYSDFKKEMIFEMIEKTIPKPDYGVLDWSGLRSEQRKIIIEALNEKGLEYKKTGDI